MPEAREAKCSFIICDEYFGPILVKDGALPLERIDMDATEKEQKRFPKSHPAHQGLPYAIDSSCTAKRGTNKSQGSVYPPMWRTTGKKKATNRLGELALVGMEYTYRGIILNLGGLFLMIQFLTHTSAHPMSRAAYESSIKVVNKEVNMVWFITFIDSIFALAAQIPCGMALVFKDHVLAFHSHDLVFQPTWACSRDDLPAAASDFRSPSWDFPSALATWMLGRRDQDRNGLACEAIRAANDVFFGIGVYTVIEIFFLAGLSPFLTEAELFDCPSRTARFGGGYVTFLDKSEKDLHKLIQPAMLDGYLAPTKQQRLGYINWLHVYAKDRCKIPVRMAELVDEYANLVAERSELPDQWVRHDTETLYDVFEPTYIRPALLLERNLGHLIFGSELWQQLGGEVPKEPDALTTYFEEQGLFNQPTFLCPGHYTPLFLSDSDFSSHSLPHRKVHTYRNDKQLWSITPFPANSRGVDALECSCCADIDSFSRDSAEPTPIEGEDRKRMLFSHIVKNTKKVAIGPLEYCGNAHRVTIGKKTMYVKIFS
ncbi:hypothetical protein R3P38DRAFT_2666075 [Favolaschia claudopus]|uniref:Uncharacterized protein n=1 Tax=Favolaschia claudopus TaxID=2862362 RepID=A0AAV9ZD69_9AGAR